MVLVQKESYLRELVRYVHNNPVRAGVVRQASASAWSSHRAYVGRQAAPEWLNVGYVLERFGRGVRAQKAFDSFVHDGRKEARQLELSGEGRGRAQTRVSPSLGDAYRVSDAIVGDDAFVRRVLRDAAKAEASLPSGHLTRGQDELSGKVSVADVAREACEIGKLEPWELEARGRTRLGMRVRVLATWAGSHLCDRLVREEHLVIAMDDLSTGSRENISHLMVHKQFRFVLHDVTTPFEVGADWIFSLACPASAIHYRKSPIKTVITNVVDALNDLSFASRIGARFFLASTSEVCGDPDVHPQVETYRGDVNPIGPRACYDEGQRCAETLCFDHYREAGVDIRVARLFNAYGPRMTVEDGRVVSNFAVQALRGQDFTNYGDGSQTRSFCFVDDHLDGLMRLMMGDEIGPVNLGNPGEFSIGELADKMLSMPRRPDITKAREKLGLQPKIALADGLRPTNDYFRSRLALQ